MYTCLRARSDKEICHALVQRVPQCVIEMHELQSVGHAVESGRVTSVVRATSSRWHLRASGCAHQWW